MSSSPRSWIPGSGQNPDAELLGRELAAAVVDPDGEGEGSRGGGGALDPTGGCLHGKARREGAGDLRPGVGGHAAAREQTDLVRDPYGAVAELVGAIGDHQWA